MVESSAQDTTTEGLNIMDNANVKVTVSQTPAHGCSVHAEGCRAATRHRAETKVRTVERLVSGFDDYADEPAIKVHACAKHLFPEHYLKGMKSDGEINFCC